MRSAFPLLSLGLFAMVGAAGCADSSNGPAPYSASGDRPGNDGARDGDPAEEQESPLDPVEPGQEVSSEDAFDLVAGEGVEFVETAATSVEEWEELEGLAGDEYDSLYPTPAGSDIKPQLFNNIGKVFKGVSFSVSRQATVPKMAKVGAFLPKSNGVTSGSLFAGIPVLSESMKKSLGDMVNKLVTGAQTQGSLKSSASSALAPAAAATAKRLVDAYGGKAADYKVAIPASFALSSGAIVSNRIYVNTASAKAVEITNIVSSGGKKTVLRVPKIK